MEIDSWRVFLAICSLPEFLACIALLAFPESPRFLILKGRHDEALGVFKKIYSLNTGKEPDTYPVIIRSSIIFRVVAFIPNVRQIKALEDEYSVTSSGERLRDKLHTCWKRIEPLFLPPNVFKLVLISMIQLGATTGSVLISNSHSRRKRLTGQSRAGQTRSDCGCRSCLRWSRATGTQRMTASRCSRPSATCWVRKSRVTLPFSTRRSSRAYRWERSPPSESFEKYPLLSLFSRVWIPGSLSTRSWSPSQVSSATPWPVPSSRWSARRNWWVSLRVISLFIYLYLTIMFSLQRFASSSPPFAAARFTGPRIPTASSDCLRYLSQCRA